jgi:hypothetical protein
MEGRQAARAETYRARGFVATSQAARRADVLRRQRERRDDAHAARRATAVAAAEALAAGRMGHGSDDAGRVRPDDDAMPPSDLQRGVRRARRAKGSAAVGNPGVPLARPEWMVEVPCDLAAAWFVLPRPDGKRCLAYASAGRTIVRSRDGRALRGATSAHRCWSALPGGRPGSRGVTILDCVAEEEETQRGPEIRRLWVLDVLIWNDRYMYDCEAQFRFFWLRNALSELDDLDDDREFTPNPNAGLLLTNTEQEMDTFRADSSAATNSEDLMADSRQADESDRKVVPSSDTTGLKGLEDEQLQQPAVDAHAVCAISSDTESESMWPHAGIEHETSTDHLRGDDLSSLSTTPGSWRRPLSPDVSESSQMNTAIRRHGRSSAAPASARSDKTRQREHPESQHRATWVRFRPVPAYDADEVGISAAADPLLSRETGIQTQDGLLFYAKEAHYELGLTPLVLSWKDPATSAHAIETFPEPPPPHVAPHDLPLIVTLAQFPSLTDPAYVRLTTCDHPPVVLAEVPAAAVASLGSNAQARLVRLRVDNTQSVAGGGQPELTLIGLAGTSRIVPDCWSRVLFQCKIRHDPLTLGDLREARFEIGIDYQNVVPLRVGIR